eukprot:c5209_g1_i2.p1 GENE.c5209_g1_i2~~c5209_g1_i2.p1  ORF type:complete len:326 (-),score=55.71 c5209_g1_i2:108-1085(-)
MYVIPPWIVWMWLAITAITSITLIRYIYISYKYRKHSSDDIEAQKSHPFQPLEVKPDRPRLSFNLQLKSLSSAISGSQNLTPRRALDVTMPRKVGRVSAWWRGHGLAEVLWRGSTRVTHYIVDHVVEGHSEKQTLTVTQPRLMLAVDPSQQHRFVVFAANKTVLSEGAEVQLGLCDIDFSHEENAVDTLVQRYVQSFVESHFPSKLIPLTKISRNTYLVGEERLSLALLTVGHGQLKCRVGGGFIEMSEWLERHRSQLSRCALDPPTNSEPEAPLSPRPPPLSDTSRSSVIFSRQDLNQIKRQTSQLKSPRAPPESPRQSKPTKP